MISRKIKFDLSSDLLSSGLCGIYFVLSGLTNRERDNDFEVYKDQRLQHLLEMLTPQTVQQDLILNGYRDLHTYYGFSNRNFPAAPETLVENLFKYHRLVHVNLLVDIYNLVSLETHLALGAHDLTNVVGDIHLRPMTGNESFWPLGSLEPKKTRSGGYSYIDDANDILCMLDSRQVEKSKVTLSTTESFYILQGNANTGPVTLRQCAEYLIALTKRYCGGELYYLYP